MEGGCNLLDVLYGSQHRAIGGVSIVAHVLLRHSQGLMAVFRHCRSVVECQQHVATRDVRIVLVGDDDGKGPRVVGRRLGNVFIDIRRTQFHVLLLDCLLVDGTVGSEHIRVDRVEMHIDVRHRVVECGGVVILVALARRCDDRQAGYRQMVVVNEILRVLKLHSVPIGCEDLGLVIASWHRDDHLAYLGRGDEKHFILCVVGTQFQMAKVHPRLVETDKLLLGEVLHLLEFLLAALLRHAVAVFIQGLIGVLLLPFADTALYERHGKGRVGWDAL